ncbi:MAG TPA: HlyD family efflux transporter periplasmic adaptor subunit [Gemmatimonadales bacterium]|nr:HlyD family efflux transporter periplasmic adaptor subunit [Gemmatimonadales bacterium]
MTGKPKLRQDLVLVEQTYRGEQSYIIKDPQSRKYFRFRPVEVMVMQTFNGEHTAAETSAILNADGLRVSPAGVEAFARKLTTMGLCERTLGERSVLQMERLRAQRRRRLGRGIGPFKGELLRIRWSVGDPDKLLDWMLPRLKFFFTPAFLRLSLALFGIYFLILAIKWQDFVRTLSDFYHLEVGLTAFAVFWLSGTLIIVIHELGHGLTCKYFGGRVHEIGAMLFYFQLAFFCNVNDAWTFPERRARLWVTAAGSWIQLVVASLAAVVWWAATPGTMLEYAAFAGVFTGGIATVLMNANPLIPLDGYYALSDYLEVPNLRQRAFAYIGWLMKTRVFKLELPPPPADERERRVFLIYGGIAAVYIPLALTLFAAASFGWLSRWLGALGIAIFLTGAFLTLRAPVKGLLQTIRESLQRRRGAANGGRLRRRLLLGAPAAVILGALVPWDINLVAPFRVAPIFSAMQSAPDSGVIQRVLVREGSSVSGGSPLLEIRNLSLERELAAARRTSDSIAALSAQARGLDHQPELTVLMAQHTAEEARVAGLTDRVDALRIRAPANGTVLTPRPQELVGRWVSNGEEVIRLGRMDSIEVRIDVSGAGSTLVGAGSRVQLLPEAGLKGAVEGSLAGVSVAAGPARATEARLRLPASGGWRPGMTGQASITVRSSNVWGALWWRLRRAVRTDILL